MATPVLSSMTDNSTKDGSGDPIQGSEVDANPNSLAKILDGTTAVVLGGDGTLSFSDLRVLDTGAAAGSVQTNFVIEWDPTSGNMTDNSSGVGVDFKMPDDANNQDVFASLNVMCVSDATGSEEGEFSVNVMKAGTNTEVLTIASGVSTFSQKVTVGVNDTGYDVQFFGATSGKHLLWDQSEDTLQLADNTNLTFGTGADADIFYDGTDLNISPAVVGSGDIVVNGASMEFADSEGVTFGTGKDATIQYDGTDLVIAPAAVGSGDVSISGGGVKLADSESLTLGTSSDATIQFDATNLVYNTAGYHSFTGGDVHLGNGQGLVVGHTAQVTAAGSTYESQILGTAAADSGLMINRASANAGGPTVVFGKSRDAIGTFSTAVSESDVAMSLLAVAADGTDMASQVAQIQAVVGATPGSNDTPGILTFSTTAEGAASVTERMRIDSSGTLFTGAETANANMSGGGITLDQNAADDEILTFKSSDVAHGMTDRTETDTYGTFAKHAATDGGLGITGYNDANGANGSFALVLTGRAGETADTTDTSASDGVVAIRAQKKSGTTTGAIGNTENLLSIDNTNTTRLILKGNGDMHITNTTLTALDEEDDVALIRAAQHVQSGGLGMAMDEWDESLCANEEDLRRVGVIRGDFLNVQRYQSLLGGGIVQVWKELKETSKRLEAAESKLALLEA